jgi:hypothetical protein
LQRAREALPALEAWRQEALKQFTRNRPLRVRDLDGSGRASSVFTENNELFFAEPGAERKRRWQDLDASRQAAVVASLLANSPPPSREVLRGAEAFAFVQGLPALAAVLARK